MSSTRTSRFLASTAVALAGVSALGATAASATAAFTFEEGNPSCADVAPAGVTWTEHKLDFDPEGPYAPNGFKVTITKGADGLGWTSELDVDAVIMKGGDNANVYFYADDDADGDTDTDDAGLRTPVNPNGNPDNGTKYFGISHVTFCSGPPATPSTPETPSTPGVTETPAPAASPTPEPEVSATAAPAPAAVAPAAVETAVLGVSIEAPTAPAPAAAAPAQLAATGVSSATLAAIAIALVLFGGLALALGGRPTTED